MSLLDFLTEIMFDRCWRI